MKKESILVFCSHSDDQVLGVGGTIAKYSQEGTNITTVIFSYGESTHPWLQRRYSAEMRVKESQKAGKIIGCSQTIFLGLKEGKFEKEMKEKKLYDNIEKIITDTAPTKIFLHSFDDPHPDHRAVYKIVMKTIERMGYKGRVFAFDIWNPIDFRKRMLPKLYVDISETFSTKLKALQCFKSQKISLMSLTFGVYLRAILAGLSSDHKYAEVFYQVK